MLRVCWFTCLLHVFPLLLLGHAPLFVAGKTFSSSFQHPVLQTSPRIVGSMAFEAGNLCRACICLSPHAYGLVCQLINLTKEMRATGLLRLLCCT
jgi:hypothetical protein